MDGYSPVLPILLYQDGIGRPIAEQAQTGSFACGRIPHHALEYPGPTVHIDGVHCACGQQTVTAKRAAQPLCGSLWPCQVNAF